jgi:hypothetical protein
MSNFRIMLLSTAAVGLAGALATPASAGEVEKSASFGGHVNRTVSIVDDGDATDIRSGDNGASMSRVRFQGSATSESLTTKAYIEVRARGNRSASNTGTAASGATLSMRHSYVSLSNSMGTLILGDTNPSGDLNGWASGMFSGAWHGADGDTLTGGEQGAFIVKGAGTSTGQEEGGLGTTVSPLTTMSSGRGGVIRYDSPDFNGVGVSASLKGGADAAEETSASVGYSADYDGTKVAVGYGYTNRAGNDATYKSFHSVGGGVELANGINAHAGYFKRSNKASGAIDPKMWTVDLGYNMSVVDAGQTSINVTYSQADDQASVNDDLNWYGINVAQELSDYGTSLYGGISRAEYSISGNTIQYEDITAGWVGVRVTF